jgi:hypothetical protein
MQQRVLRSWRLLGGPHSRHAGAAKHGKQLHHKAQRRHRKRSGVGSAGGIAEKAGWFVIAHLSALSAFP